VKEGNLGVLLYLFLPVSCGAKISWQVQPGSDSYVCPEYVASTQGFIDNVPHKCVQRNTKHKTSNRNIQNFFEVAEHEINQGYKVIQYKDGISNITPKATTVGLYQKNSTQSGPPGTSPKEHLYRRGGVRMWPTHNLTNKWMGNLSKWVKVK